MGNQYAKYEGLNRKESKQYIDLMRKEKLSKGQIKKLKELHEKSDKATKERKNELQSEGLSNP